jgi:hypothetical protein
MGEIDELDGSVDKGVTQGNQGVHGPELDAVDNLLDYIS